MFVIHFQRDRFSVIFFFRAEKDGILVYRNDAVQGAVVDPVFQVVVAGGENQDRVAAAGRERNLTEHIQFPVGISVSVVSLQCLPEDGRGRGCFPEPGSCSDFAVD